MEKKMTTAAASPARAAPEIKDMPMMTRAAPVLSVDAETRSAELCWSTGAGVRRYDWYNERYYMEELSMDPAHIRLGRLQAGASLLNSHSGYDLSSILGVTESAEIRNGEGISKVRFSAREDVEPYFQDVRGGIIRHVSVGYQVHAIERVPPEKEGELWIYRAVDWEPYELSLVAIPADPGAGMRSDPSKQSGGGVASNPCKFFSRSAAADNSTPLGAHMDPTETNPNAAETNAANNSRNADHEKQVREMAIQQERTRVQDIQDATRKAGLDATFADKLIADGMEINNARAAIINEMAERSSKNPTRKGPYIETLVDEGDTLRNAISDAIVLRVDPNNQAIVNDFSRAQAARQHRGMNLLELARMAVERTGVKTSGMSRREIATAALGLNQVRGMHSTSDFPEILGNTVSRALRTAYMQMPRTFMPFTRESVAPDFREMARVQLSESPAFKSVKEGGEYKMLAFGESAEKYALAKSGGIVAITWETLINDDLNAFQRIPTALAAEASALESDIVYGILLGASVMSDGENLFSAGHANLAAPASLITVDNLTAGRAAIRQQVGLKGRALNLAPQFLITGPLNEGDADKYTSANFVAAKSLDINPAFNRSLTPIIEQRLTGRQWFLACAPGLIDTIEYAYLEGEQGLYTEQRMGFEVDGLQIKARHCFAAKAIDWRGLYKNAGS
jgi:hypothetical protein